MTLATVSTGVRFAEQTAVRREARRKFVVRWVFVLFALMLIEGPLRKWVLPGLSGPLVLLRDPVVIGLYAYCFANGLIWKRGLGEVWLVFAWVTTLLALGQYAFNDYGLDGWLLGVRTYWLYMPLALVVAKTFWPEDVERLLRWVLIVAVPYSLLVAVQYNAPPTAFVNQGVGADGSTNVALEEGILRPFGLFTYTGPNVQYTAFSIAAFLAFYLSGARLRHRTLFLLVTGTAVGAMSVLTGSRGIYFIAGTTILLTAGGLLAMRPNRRTFAQVLGIGGFVALAGILFVTAFPDMLSAMDARFERAARVEGSIWSRVLFTLSSWIEPLMKAPVLGHGLGLGAPGVAAYLGAPALQFGDSDLSRNVYEVGLIGGLVFIMLRWITGAWLIIQSLRLARSGVLLALPLAGFTVVILTVGSITHSPYNAFLPWLVLGMIVSYKKSVRWRSR